MCVSVARRYINSVPSIQAWRWIIHIFAVFRESCMVTVYPVGISPKLQNNKSLIFNLFRSLARYASHSGNIAFKGTCIARRTSAPSV